MKKIIATAFVVSIIALMVILVSTAQAKPKMVSTENYYCHSYEIQRGDTLWSIAEEYKADTDNITAYIETIKQMNGLHSDGITSGKYLVILVTK